MKNLKISRIKLNNFKNVTNGEVNFMNNEKISNVIGFYGQNGSGKTSIVEALQIFKILVSGDSLDYDVIDLIEYGKNSLKVEIEFYTNDYIDNNEEDGVDQFVNYIYSFEIAKSKILNKNKKENDDSDNIELKNLEKELNEEKEEFRPIVLNENIYINNELDNKNSTRKLISIDLDNKLNDFLIINPKPEIIDNIDNKTDFLLSSKLAKANSKSFLFLDETFETFERIVDEELKMGKSNTENDFMIVQIYLTLHKLKDFSKRITIILNNQNAYVLSNYALPLNLYLETNKKEILMDLSFSLSIKDSEVVSKMRYIAGKGLLSAINKVLPLIIPKLKVYAKILNKELNKSGEEAYRIALVSDRDGMELPFHTESDGIKKIVSLLAGIVQIFNNESNILVIDELDSGIYEFLLGEILTMVSENAKGQLIFTSHNLRALEVLELGDIIFTTTNPSDRYLKPNLDKNLNLRNEYIRGIQVDSFEEVLYESANTSKIKLALLKSKKELENLNKEMVGE